MLNKNSCCRNWHMDIHLHSIQLDIGISTSDFLYTSSAENYSDINTKANHSADIQQPLLPRHGR